MSAIDAHAREVATERLRYSWHRRDRLESWEVFEQASMETADYCARFLDMGDDDLARVYARAAGMLRDRKDRMLTARFIARLAQTKEPA